ncbi:hypothetical protein BpHYR1_032783 [Brachionus plicatilis]|uniref:Uncharacterized protein n=1 Tax=Brachionus plicatilis TaxID=10195 RepID=A0A3M7ST71_BRAPC|nr:hypothetical protein BpHYR1_032783 [Brachionus plicatilis]
MSSYSQSNSKKLSYSFLLYSRLALIRNSFIRKIRHLDVFLQSLPSLKKIFKINLKHSRKNTPYNTSNQFLFKFYKKIKTCLNSRKKNRISQNHESRLKLIIVSASKLNMLNCSKITHFCIKKNDR